ncbi:hypothetical protein CsSME_00032955 [Camellia sinensis var. sinensis]
MNPTSIIRAIFKAEEERCEVIDALPVHENNMLQHVANFF